MLVAECGVDGAVAETVHGLSQRGASLGRERTCQVAEIVKTEARATGSDSGRNQYLLIYRRRQGVSPMDGGAGAAAAAQPDVSAGASAAGAEATPLDSPPPESPPRPGEALAAAIRAEEEEAIEIRALKETSDVVANLSVVPAAALTLETTVTLHSATPAHELPRRAAEAIAAAAAEVATTTHMAKPPPSHPHTASQAAAAAVAAAARDGAKGVGQLRLRRWDALHGLPEQPLSAQELSHTSGATLRSLCLAPRGAVLLETRPAGVEWPLPSSDDLYVRARAWTPRRATKAGTATAGAGVEGSAGDGDGAGNAPAVNTTNGDGDGDGSAGEAAADNDDGTDGPVRLLCVPAGCRRDATLHQLVTAASAEFDVPVELLRIVRQQAGGAWQLLASGAEAFGGGKQGAPGAAGGEAAGVTARGDGGGGGDGGDREGGGGGHGEGDDAVGGGHSGGAATTLAALRLKAGDDLWVERAASAAAPSLLVASREAARHQMKISFNLLGASEFTEELAVDGRATLADLKAKIAERLERSVTSPPLPPSRLRLRRSTRGAHLKAEATTVVGDGGAGLTDGSAVYVEEGMPLGKDDVLIRGFLCERTRRPSIRDTHGEKGGEGGGTDEAVEASARDAGCDPLASKVGGDVVFEVVAREAMKMGEVRRLAHAALLAAAADAEAAAGTATRAAPLGPSLHTSGSVFKRAGARPVRCSRRQKRTPEPERRLRRQGGGVQCLSHEEKLGDDALLVRWRLVLLPTWEEEEEEERKEEEEEEERGRRRRRRGWWRRSGRRGGRATRRP